MIVRTLEVGMLRTNCYLVVSESSREAAVIDPGGDPALTSNTRGLEATTRGFLLTHFSL